MLAFQLANVVSVCPGENKTRQALQTTQGTTVGIALPRKGVSLLRRSPLVTPLCLMLRLLLLPHNRLSHARIEHLALHIQCQHARLHLVTLCGLGVLRVLQPPASSARGRVHADAKISAHISSVSGGTEEMVCY